MCRGYNNIYCFLYPFITTKRVAYLEATLFLDFLFTPRVRIFLIIISLIRHQQSSALFCLFVASFVVDCLQIIFLHLKKN